MNWPEQLTLGYYFSWVIALIEIMFIFNGDSIFAMLFGL